MNDVTKNGNASTSLSTDYMSQLARLEAGILKSKETTIISGGKPLLRLLKSAVWVYGQNNDEVQDGSEWMINPLSMLHGYSCWSDYPGNQKNELLGEAMAPITEPKPLMPDPIKGYPFKQQAQFDLKCDLGEDKGIEVVYKTSSIGGIRAVDGLQSAIIAQLRADPAHIVPVVQLLHDDYDHQKYGQTFVPIFKIVAWADMNGGRAGQPAVAAPVQPQRGPGAAEAVAAKAAPAAAEMTRAAAPRRQRPAVVK